MSGGTESQKDIMKECRRYLWDWVLYHEGDEYIPPVDRYSPLTRWYRKYKDEVER